MEGGKKLKCMVMFQYSTCDMHFGTVKFIKFSSKFFFKKTDRMVFFNLIEPQVCLFRNKEGFQQNYTDGCSGYVRGNTKPCRSKFHPFSSNSFLSIWRKTFLSFINKFLAFRNLYNIDFVLSCMDVLARNA